MNAQQRTRHGCWTCRKRKKKCDSQSIPCTSCIRLNLECKSGVQLIWEDDKRRVGMRRRGPPTTKSMGDTSGSYLSVKKDDTAMEVLAVSPHSPAPTSARADAAQGQVPDTSIILPIRYSFGTLNEKESLLLDHYIQRFSRTYPTCHDTTNPFLSVLLPISMRSPLVLDSMLALSGAQRGTESGRELQETTLSIRQRALAGCREMLQSPTLPSSQEAQIQTLNSMKDEERLTLLASCILLLLYEKISGEGKTNWMPHLDFIHEIWSSHNNGSKSSSSLIDAFIFLRNLYLYNDLVRSTSLRVPTQSNFYLQCGEVEKGRYYYPHLISRLSRHDSTVTDADILRWDGCMNWLPSFALNRHGNSNSTAGEANDEWIISVLYRTTALIYRRQMSFESQVFDFPQTAELAEQAVESMECLPEGSPFENTLLWPIGIVAKSLGMERVSARATILRRLDSLNRRFQMKHFMRAQEILINHWQNMDNNWQHGIATPFGMGLELQADTILLG